MNDKRFLIILLAVLLLGAGAFYYFNYYEKPAPAMSFQQGFESAKASHMRGGNRIAVKTLEQILPKASTKEEEAVAKLLLGRSYFAFEGDKGLKILLETAENNSYPAMYRALAYQYIADAYLLGSRNQGLRQTFNRAVFSKEPYSSFVANDLIDTTRIGRAVGRIYELASELYPLPISEYRTAERYARAPLTIALGEGETKLDMPVSDYITKAKEHLEKGNAAMANFSDPILGEIAIAYANWLKGSVLGYLDALEKKTTRKEEAENEFKKALVILDSKKDPFYFAHSLWARFYYAAFLERAYGASRKEDIKNLLALMSDPRFEITTGLNVSQFGFAKYLVKIGVPEGWGLDRASALMLAKIDKSFGEFLKSLGWKF